MGDFPTDEMALSQILVVEDPGASRAWYTDVLGAELFRAYGESVVLSFCGAWLLLVPAGGPTEDKPGVEMVPPDDPDRVSNAFTIRVPDCRRAYEILRGRGAEFLTAPLDRGAEVRCFFRDPDGNLFEISEAR